MKARTPLAPSLAVFYCKWLANRQDLQNKIAIWLIINRLHAVHW